MFNNGEILDEKYRILEHIGTGGGGIVYKAYQIGLGRTVAIKQIKDEVSGKLDEHGESNILKNLKNDHIPAVYDFIRKDGGIYTVMEFVEGRSLQEHLDCGRRFTQKEIIKYARQLCEAVKYLHSRKPPVIHSDIKPANIMLTPEGNICLIDYNISLIVNGTETAIGVSDGYSPPEQYGKVYKKSRSGETDVTLLDNEEKYTVVTELEDTDDETKIDMPQDGLTLTMCGSVHNETPAAVSGRKIDKRSDIYAVGATIYHLAAGRRPASSLGKVEPLSCVDGRISDGLATVVNKAMRKEPSKRFESAEQMLKAVNSLGRYDKRYKAALARQEAAVIAVIAAMAASALTSAAGYIKVQDERQDKYGVYLASMESADINESEKAYDDAIKLFPQRAEAYEAKAMMMFAAGDFSSAAEYISGVLDGAALVSGENEEAYYGGSLYYILGRCCLETGQYESAAAALEKAVAADGDKQEYYRDYAAALARCGDIQKARNILEIAEQKGLSDENILFAEGEIEYKTGNYSESIDKLSRCIDIAEDNILVYRAYIIAANAYSEAYAAKEVSGSQRIDFLRKAVSQPDIEKTMPFYEMLAQAYIDEAASTGDMSLYYSAIEAYEKMNSLGWETTASDYALIRLYRITGNYAYAKEFALKLESSGGGDYILYKLLAFIELDIQNAADSTKRDYTAFKEYYAKAKELCTDTEDFELRLLDDAYEKLNG